MVHVINTQKCKCMRKIMFNDKFSLTDHVILGRKTMTRRVANIQPPKEGSRIGWLMDSTCANDSRYEGRAAWFCGNEVVSNYLDHYKVDEIIAVAMSYKYTHCHDWKPLLAYYPDLTEREDAELLAGWNNKMFVKAEAMPYHIRITEVKVERMQDICEEDAIKEGILFDDDISSYYYLENHIQRGISPTAKEAFSKMIDKISGKGTWDSNPYVFAYEFYLLENG